MAISNKDVEQVARLARIALTKEETKKFTTELDSVLAFVKQLDEVDVSDVPETSHVTGLTNVVRPDTPRPGIVREEFLKGAPDTKENHLKVKGVF